MSYRPNGKKGDGINLSHFLVGSEGTLGYFTKVKLKLSALPSKKVMGVCHFPSFYESMDAAQHIVKLKPVSVELIDDTMLKLANDIQIFKQTVKDIVVGNPANTNALIVCSNTPDIPNENISSLMRLDQNRAKSILSSKVGQHVSSVTKLVVWGNHSTTQYPDISHAQINNSNNFFIHLFQAKYCLTFLYILPFCNIY